MMRKLKWSRELCHLCHGPSIGLTVKYLMPEVPAPGAGFTTVIAIVSWSSRNGFLGVAPVSEEEEM